MPRTYTKTPTIDRIMAKVVADGTCWLWCGSIGSSGYGKISDENGRHTGTHRAVYEYHRGPILDGLVLDHLCGRIRCVNPDHLEPVTQAENRRRQSERRTACNAGHIYTEASTYTGRNGRECRICHAERERSARARRKKAKTDSGK